MSRWTIKKSSLQGTIRIPPSKSHTLRAILFAALAEGKSVIRSYLASHDAEAMLEAVRNLGAKVQVFPDRIEIVGTGGRVGPFEDVIQAGNSGIVLRFLAALAGLSSYPAVITGDYSIRHQRPMGQLNRALAGLGVRVESLRGDGYAPLIIQGPMTQDATQLSGEDSQPVSALLIAAAFKKNRTEISVENPGELPWIGLTLDWFSRLGIACQNEDFRRYRLDGNASYKGFEYTVPGDFSSAAFPLVAALVTRSTLTLENLDMNDSQGDKEIIPVLRQMGAEIDIDPRENKVRISLPRPLKGIEVSVNRLIDAVTALAVAACYAEGETRIYGAEVARSKESNRLKSIAEELTKMGGNIQETDEGLLIRGAPLKGAAVFSHLDHRMAMSLAVAALGAEGETVIEACECVAKTYPGFAKDFQSLGARLHE